MPFRIVARYSSALIAVCVGFALSGGRPSDGHLEKNAIFRELLQAGAKTLGSRREILPPPTMADGLAPDQQRAVLERLAAEGGLDVDEFTRNSVVARFVQRLDDVGSAMPEGSIRRLDVWFVAYAPFEKLADKTFLDQLGGANGKDGAAQPIDPSSLAKRGIRLGPDEEGRIGYGHVTANLMNRVELRMTGKSEYSRTGDSVLIASLVDDRFVGDPDFPNQWRHTSGDNGEPVPYRGGGYYMKITKLHEPAGALLIESHSLFIEPKEWFGGANTLRSKLPAVMESQVRSVRRAMLKASD